MKACPFCSEKIPDVATVCPHCGHDLAAAAADAQAQLKGVGGSCLTSLLWIGSYIGVTTLVRATILYFTAPTLRHWSLILSGATALLILAYGVFRAHQQKRSGIRLWLLVYSGFVVFQTWAGIAALLSE